MYFTKPEALCKVIRESALKIKNISINNGIIKPKSMYLNETGLLNEIN